MSKQQACWMVYGVVTLLVVKYGVVGLDAWDGLFHPGRVEPNNLYMFRKPLLGLVNYGGC